MNGNDVLEHQEKHFERLQREFLAFKNQDPDFEYNGHGFAIEDNPEYEQFVMEDML